MIVTEDNFEEKVLKANNPVLIDFFASWCAPCKLLAPVIDEVSQELKEKVDVFKINIDDSINTASNYNVRSIPTLVLFNNGKVIDTKVGKMEKDDIISWINSKLT